MYAVYAWAGLSVASREGAHTSAMPVVPWSHVITGQPFFGALPFGPDPTPDTAIALPSVPTERYRTSQLAPADSRAGSPLALRAQIRSPCALPGSGLGGV